MKTKKILALALAAVLLVAVSVGGTMAWLADTTQEVTNTFNPTTLDVGLNESPNLDFTMIPGATIAKDPKVTWDTDVEAWVFVEITESENLDDFITYDIASGWEQLDTTNVYYRSVAASENAIGVSVIVDANGVEDQVTVKDSVTKVMMDELIDDADKKPTLTFKAYIIQKSVSTDPATAWAAIADPDNNELNDTNPDGSEK